MARVTIVQTSFNSGELSPYMDARIDQSRYATGCKVLRNMLLAPHGAAYRRPGFRYLGDAVHHSGDRTVRLIPFVFNEDQAYVLEFGNKGMRVWHKSGLIQDDTGHPLVVPVEYTDEHLWTLRHCQSADVLYIVSPYYPPYRLERHAHNVWKLVKVQFGSSIAPPTALKATVTGETSRTYWYVVTAVGADNDEESLGSASISCNAAPVLNTANYVTLSWQAAPGAKEYRVYRNGGGQNNYGFIGRAAGTQFIDRGLEADFSQSLQQEKTVFATTDEYPSMVQFYQQRLCFASSKKHPQTVWASQVGNYHNMNVSRPLRADDACTVTIAADRVNAIRWMVASRKLLLGTVDGEWTLSGYGGEAFSALSSEVDRQGARGSADLPALNVGDSILYVQRGANVVREFRYSLDSDGYGGNDLTILGEHIMRHRKIIDWAWQQTPHSVLWCVLDDGTMAGLTLIREHEVVAWHRHNTDGVIEAVTVIPGAEGDEAWFVVRRSRYNSVTGQTDSYRSIERLDPQFQGETAEQAFFVDAGLSWQGVPVTLLKNLDHLEGKTVHILADGWVHPPQVVMNGSVTLERPASIVHVGLPYYSDIAPMASEPVDGQGLALGMKRRVNRVRFRLYRSLGCKVGPDEGKLREVVFRNVQHPLGTPLPLFTGDTTTQIDAVVSTSGGVYFRQDDPLPFTLLACAHEMDIGEI